MRILHLDAGEEMRGGQHQVLLLMQELGAKGHEQTLLANPKGVLRSSAAALGFVVGPLSAYELWRHSHTATIVHAHDARSHTAAALWSRQPFVVSRRVAFPVGRGVLSYWKYRRANRFLAVSRWVAGELERARVPAHKIDIVYDGVELPPPREVGSGQREFRMLALASHDSQKGRDLVEAAARRAGLPIDFSSDLSKDLPRASVFVYITRSEGLGSAALLAMGHGAAIIASRVGGLPEAVRDEREGLLIENDVPAIAGAMQRLHTDPCFARQLGENGRERAQQLFTRHHMGEATLNTYRRALEE